MWYLIRMSTEKPLNLPEDQMIRYFDGIKGYRNEVVNFNFVLKPKIADDPDGFVECIEFVLEETNYAGLHVTDTNWYEEGNYKTGILEPRLLDTFDRFFRLINRLKEEHTLSPICYFTNEPRGFRSFMGVEPIRRPDLMICFEGGEHDDWGQYMQVYLVEGSHPFELDYNPKQIEEIKNKARLVGKQIMTDGEFLQEWKEVRKRMDEQSKHFKEEAARWAAELEEN